MDVSMSEVIGEFVEAWVEKNRDKLSRATANSEQPQSVAQIVQQNFWTLREHNIKNIDAIAKGATPTKRTSCESRQYSISIRVSYSG
jgi:hypothetical protein